MENVNQNNEILARFIADDSSPEEILIGSTWYLKRKDGSFSTEYGKTELNFHKDYNMIMKVVNFIENNNRFNNKHNIPLLTIHIIGRNTKILRSGATSYSSNDIVDSIKENPISVFGTNKLESIYLAVLEFVNRYNELNVCK